MPIQTPYMGLWLRKEDKIVKTESRLSHEKAVLKKLIEQLPSTVFSLQIYPPSLQNWLPFWWAGYHVEPRMLYVIEDLQNIDQVWQGLKDKAINTIRKAEKLNFSIETQDDLDSFYELFKKSVDRIRYETNVTKQKLKKLHEEIRKKDAGKMFFARNIEGEVIAALYIVWDEQIANYWLATGNLKGENNGANSLLLWNVLLELNRRGIKRLEVTGSMNENLASYISAFGAKQETFFKMTKYGNRFFAFLHFLMK